MVSLALAEKFEKYTMPCPPSDCLLWIGGANSDGQPYVGHEGKTVLANRAAFFLKHGRWPTHQACHTCDTPLCVNGDHLYDGTQQDNMNDKMRRGRFRCPKGEKHYACKFGDEIILEVLQRLATGEIAERLAEEFGMSTSYVSHLKKGKRRKGLA